VTRNDTTLQGSFPYVQQPWAGFRGPSYSATPYTSIRKLNVGTGNEMVATSYPNPFSDKTTIRYNLASASDVTIEVLDINGKRVAAVRENESQLAGVHTIEFNTGNLEPGVYFANIISAFGHATVKMIIHK
jgi:hypothetical protein